MGDFLAGNNRTYSQSPIKISGYDVKIWVNFTIVFTHPTFQSLVHDLDFRGEENDRKEQRTAIPPGCAESIGCGGGSNRPGKLTPQMELPGTVQLTTIAHQFNLDLVPGVTRYALFNLGTGEYGLDMETTPEGCNWEELLPRQSQPDLAPDIILRP